MFSLPVLAGVASTALLAQHAASRAIEGDVSQMTAEDNVEQLIKQFNAATGEFLKGNPEPGKKLYSHRQDVTLANPLGPAVRGWEQVAATIEHAASQMRDGEIVDVENVVKYATPELAYIVRIERAEAKVGGREAVTPVSLRVTMIMRPEEGVWKVVHRHADPITAARPAESVIQQ
jgi:ketosteroid isomerase-like protein